MHASSHASLTVPHVGCISTFTYFLSAAFKRYNINKHHRRSLSGLGSQHQGKLPVSPSRIHDKHKHIYPRRFFGLFILLFFREGKHQKASCISGYALETWITD